MVITRLEQPEQRKKAMGHVSTRSSKIKVYIDEEYAFPINIKDREEYGLKEGMELSEVIYHKLLWEVVLGHAKQKALTLLKFHDRTEVELTQRLREEGYPELILHKTIEYVAEYGYLNDIRYASNYIRTRKSVKSKLVLTVELTAKGIRKDLIQQLFLTEYEEQEEDPELSAIRKAIQKKTSDPTSLSREEKQKLMAHLYRKGFSAENIRKALEEDLE